jgi:hypothetical protein
MIISTAADVSRMWKWIKTKTVAIKKVPPFGRTFLLFVFTVLVGFDSLYYFPVLSLYHFHKVSTVDITVTKPVHIFH